MIKNGTRLASQVCDTQVIVVRSADTLDDLRCGGVPMVAIGAERSGELDPAWNLNGATNSIAGIVNEQGNVFGMMPHPENHVEASIGVTDGRGLFAGLADHLAKAA